MGPILVEIIISIIYYWDGRFLGFDSKNKKKFHLTNCQFLSDKVILKNGGSTPLPTPHD